MKRSLVAIIMLLSCCRASSQVATIDIKDSIAGLCNGKNVYVLFPVFGDQLEAVCPLSDEEILKKLNDEVPFLKKNTNYNDKGMVNTIINCKGEVVKCEMDNKTKSKELDKQIIAVFNSLGIWKPGTLNGREVNSAKLWRFEIKKTVISFD